MAVRGLVIAIENYSAIRVGGIAKTLPGTLQAGLEFKKWLEEKWAAERRTAAETQLLLCTEPVQAGGVGATRNDILKTLLRLKQEGQSTTDELYVFLSGHGFSFVQKPGSRVDVVLTSDFEEPALSTHCCLNLDEIVDWLRDHLGPGRHYYFVDACRNPLDASQIQVGPLLPIDSNASAEASTFILQSTVEGSTAAVSQTFPTILMAGLRGKGRAKTWDPGVSDAMLVRYDSLRQFVKTSMAKSQPIASRAEGPEGEADAILATLRPIPLSQCTIRIDNVLPQDSGEISLKRGRSTADERKPFGSEPLVLEVEPDLYSIAVRLKNASVVPADPIAVDLFDDRTIVFTRARSALRGPSPAPSGPLPSLAKMEAAGIVNVDVVVPPGGALTLKDVASGNEQRFEASARASVPAGRYLAKVAGSDGRTLRQRELELVPGKDASVNLLDWKRSVPHVAIARRLPEQAGLVDFSESLGPVADTDLNLWLAIIGAGRLLGSRGDYSKLVSLPLHDFTNETAGASPVYVLAGFDNPATTMRIGLSRNADVAWTDAAQPPDMPGIREVYLPVQPGSQLVSFDIDGQPPYTVASHASPNRGMLITLTVDEEGSPRVSQYLLPIGHLVQNLPEAVRTRLEYRNQLNDVRFLARASRAFRKRRDVAKEVGVAELNDLLYAKWLDPIASSLAAYELVRRGRREALPEVVSNMKTFFPDIPDTAALAKLSGEPVNRPPGIPLFFDGLKAFPNYADWLPLPAGHLDFTSSWTAWRAAVARASASGSIPR
jgi:caspase domain-containing protein